MLPARRTGRPSVSAFNTHVFQPSIMPPHTSADEPSPPPTKADELDGLFTREGTHDGMDAELGGWVYDTLQRLQPGVEISVGSVKAVVDLLDGVTVSVLEEAKRISQGGAGASADAGGGAPQGRCRSKAAPLTSLDIHQALKRVLPCSNQPGERLRPYLPAVTKHAWHLDKQSLKGVKKRRRDVESGEGGAAAPLADGPQLDSAADTAAAIKENALTGGPAASNAADTEIA